MKNIKNLLDYWYKIEFFSPFWPEKTYKTFTSSSPTKKLPWEDGIVPNYDYNVYIGKVSSQTLVYKILNVLNLKSDSVEPDNSLCCICSLTLSNQGFYSSSDFCISTFIWSVCQILNEKKLDVQLNIEEMKELVNTIKKEIPTFENPITYSDLEFLLELTLKHLSLEKNIIEFCVIINPRYAKEEMLDKPENEKNADSPPQSFGNMITSFYINDIETIRSKNHLPKHIMSYINALIKPPEHHIEIDQNISEMKKVLSPECFPLGKWPSKFSPSLMQQLSINLAIKSNSIESNIFSVNGPPGTGKTTLLKEIIASNIVERAICFTNYKKPDDAFQKLNFKNPEQAFFTFYYKPDDSLIPFGMLVASNNNAAVENISKELPLADGTAKEKCNTPLFDINNIECNYFSDIADQLDQESDKPCWGLISAHLGNKKNIFRFKKELWFSSEHNTLRSYYSPSDDNPIPNWENAKVSFQKKYDEVLSYRNIIIQDTAQLEKLQLLKMELNSIDKQLDTLLCEDSKIKTSMNSLQSSRNQLETKQMHMSATIESLTNSKLSLQEACHILRKKLPFWIKYLPFLFHKNKKLLALKEYDEQLVCLLLELSEKEKALSVISNEYAEISIKVVDLENQIKQNADVIMTNIEKRKLLNLSINTTDNYLKEKYKNNFADNDYWLNIQKNHSSQAACPWTTKEYDTLREELFYEALMLQKSFILNSRAIKHNINCLVNLWGNKIALEDIPLCHAHLLNTLFFVVPVISTTFASITQFLYGISENQLGTLIIDEAGQATPQSALGAIWRNQRAIIVGDPLQVEPIITTPKELCKKFADESQIDISYRPLDISVQILADQLNPYGAYRSYLGSQIWVGCPLVVHRRCLNPMFSISNQIAYDNKMFQETVDKTSILQLSLNNSIWYNITGKEEGDKNHFVILQGQKVLELVCNSFQSSLGFPDLYIISPFKSVIHGITELLTKELPLLIHNISINELHHWLNRSCGTIHTFQGKEANEVILVLGCDNNSGRAAAEWAGRKPNILNVAVTRAKYRIAIIGDYSLWKDVPYYSDAYKIINNYQCNNIFTA